MTVADFTDAAEIIANRRHGPRRRADDRLGDEDDDGFRAQFSKLFFQRAGGARRIVLLTFVFALEAIGKAGIDMVGFGEQRTKLLAPPLVAAGGQRAQRIAMIALAAADDVAVLRLVNLDEILARHLQRRLDRLRPARNQIDMLESLRRTLYQPFAEPFGNLASEETGMSIGDLVQLLVQRLKHRRMSMPEAGNSCAAGCVDIGLALRIYDFDAARGDCDRRSRDK